MDSVLNFNIDTIYTVIYKREPFDFRFDNPGRDWDGFVLFTGGNAVFSTNDGRQVSCARGTLLLLRRHDVYSILSSDGCDYITSAFDFSPYCTEGLRKIPTAVTCSEDTIKWIAAMEKKWQLQQWDSQIRCRIGLLELYADLLHTWFKPGAEVRDSMVNAAVEYIHRHFRENFSATQIADHCAVSPSYLRARFRECMNMTITEYRNDLRINAAKQMLQSGLFSVKETAVELGYCDVYYFSKCFAAETGVTPARFSATKGDPNKLQ